MSATADNITNGAASAPSLPIPAREKPLVPTGDTGAIEVFASAANFEQAYRMAQALSQSSLVPKDYQGSPSNVLIAINIASRVKADPFAVMQSLDIIQGRPSWRATFVIAMVNTCGKFAPLQFHLQGEGMARGCTAWTVPSGIKIPLPPQGKTALAFAKELNLPVIEGPEVTMAMAKAEGWIDRTGSKWKTIPELMLRYRAAAFFGRLNAPELLLGMQTAEEEQDRTIDVTPREHTTGVAGARALLADTPKVSATDPKADADLAKLHAATTLKSLEEAYTPIVQSWVEANSAVPDAIENAYVNRKLSLEQAQG